MLLTSRKPSFYQHLPHPGDTSQNEEVCHLMESVLSHLFIWNQVITPLPQTKQTSCKAAAWKISLPQI